MPVHALLAVSAFRGQGSNRPRPRSFTRQVSRQARIGFGSHASGNTSKEAVLSLPRTVADEGGLWCRDSTAHLNGLTGRPKTSMKNLIQPRGAGQVSNVQLSGADLRVHSNCLVRTSPSLCRHPAVLQAQSRLSSSVKRNQVSGEITCAMKCRTKCMDIPTLHLTLSATGSLPASGGDLPPAGTPHLLGYA